MLDHPTIRPIMDYIAMPGVLLSTLLGYLPAILSVVALGYYALQIYESRTVQLWLRTRRERKIAAYQKRIEQLQAQAFKAKSHNDTL